MPAPRSPRWTAVLPAPRALLLLLALAALLPAAARGQDTPPGYEPGIYELVLEGLPAVSLPALVSPAGKVLVPLRPVLELAGAPFHIAADSGLASVSRPRGIGTATLDLRTRTLRAAREVALAQDDALAWNGDLYLATGTLGELLEAQATLSQEELVLALARDPPFPAQEREEVRARRERELARGPGTGADSVRVPFVPRNGGGVVEWGASAGYPGPARSSALFTRVGFSLAGGMASVGATAAGEGAGGPALQEVTAAWQRVFPEGSLVRQLRVGDVVTEGLRPRSVRGVVVTNAPFARDALFGEAALRPRLPSGWEYEVYQEGRLLGYSDAASSAPVSIPLRYGSTPVELRLLGPAGERITSELVYLVPVLQLPAGRWQYSLGGGVCPRGQRCDGYGYADLRRGVSSRVTVFGGVDVAADSAGSRVRPYGGASLVPARAWVVELQGMQGSFYQATVQSFGTGRVTGAAGAGLTLPGRESVSVVGAGGFPLLPAGRRSWHADGALRMRLGEGDALLRTLDLSARVDRPVAEPADSAARGLERSQLSAALALRRVLAEATRESGGGEKDLYLGRLTFPVVGLPRPLGTPTLSAAAGYDGAGLRRWEASATVQPAGAIVTLTARGNRGAKPVFLLGSTLRLGWGRAQSRVLAQPGQPAQGALSVEGAATFGQGTGVRPLRYGGLGMAGVTGFVFRDADGDGVFGAGEEGVADAAVTVGGVRVRTDGAGRYRTWGLLPYEVLPVSLDTTTLADPSWVPRARDTLLRPPPHLYSHADFALVPTRELTGRLIPGPGVPTAGAVTVEITGAAPGEVQKTITFSDGEFYVGRMRPGSYEVRVAASSLRALNARSEPAVVRVVVPASGDEPLVEVPAIRLVHVGP